VSRRGGPKEFQSWAFVNNNNYYYYIHPIYYVGSDSGVGR
jgi:hypothetical protein